jgi:hypothetical protein
MQQAPPVSHAAGTSSQPCSRYLQSAMQQVPPVSHAGTSSQPCSKCLQSAMQQVPPVSHAAPPVLPPHPQRHALGGRWASPCWRFPMRPPHPADDAPPLHSRTQPRRSGVCSRPAAAAAKKGGGLGGGYRGRHVGCLHRMSGMQNSCSHSTGTLWFESVIR